MDLRQYERGARSIRMNPKKGLSSVVTGQDKGSEPNGTVITATHSGKSL